MRYTQHSNLVLRCAFAVTIALTAAACGSDGNGTGSDGVATSTTSAPIQVDRAPVDPAAPDTEIAAAFNQVGWMLWSNDAALPAADNLVISPSSIGHALLLARAAADEPTVAAIDAALPLPEGLAAHEGWNAIDQAISVDTGLEEELTVTVADRIWPRLDVTPDPEWITTLARYHGADVQPLDFVGDSSGSREVINQWVGDRTEGLIPTLLPEGFITADTVLALTDAIYFKARWATVFAKYGPTEGDFTLLDGSTVPVEFMRELELPSRRGSGDGYVGAEIPYVGDTFSMLVIVPDEGRFDEIRNRLGPDLLGEIDAGFTTGPFELLLPKWKDKTEQLDLLPWLSEIGAAPGAYPGISPDAFLDSAVHGADIEVDEWGTVAAAATGLGFDESGAPEPQITVAADQPFLYLIRHTETGLVLFLGQVTDPTIG